jgi:hypothetical protein
LWLSPIGFLGHFGRKSSETLDFPGKRRKRHAETTESSGKSGVKERFALISYHYFYFGRNAIDISDLPRTHLDRPFEKAGPGHRCNFSEEFVDEFAKWLKANFKVGIHGPPCKPHSELKLSK